MNQNYHEMRLENDSDVEDFNFLFADDEEEEELEYAIIMQAIELGMHEFASAIRNHINRNRIDGDERLFADYFAETPVYNDKVFRRRFRMRHDLFFRICEAVIDNDGYFIQKRDAAGILGYSTLQKVTAALRMLCYGVSADSLDEYLRMSESVALESTKKFCRSVIDVFSDEYLRKPNQEDIDRLLDVGARRGFPGMLGSIDCMHWVWKNCPTSWHGQYIGKEKQPTLILEAVASYDLWIWHSFFGLPGSLNDINVLDRSDVLEHFVEDNTPSVRYTRNGKQFDMGHYLADGIYPNYATFVKSISCPSSAKQKNFAKLQEVARKDVERAFGVLQARLNIIKAPARFWSQSDLHMIMKTCIILHNMIVEDEREIEGLEVRYEQNVALQQGDEDSEGRHRLNVYDSFADFVRRHGEVVDRGKHFELRDSLIEHLWRMEGSK